MVRGSEGFALRLGRWLATPQGYLPVLALVTVLAVPLLTRDVFLLNLLIFVFLFAMLGEAWNMLGGYGTQLSIGHAAYFGLGAYTSTLLLVNWHVSPWLGMLVGAAAAMLLSLVLGASCFRLRGPYFAIATIGVAEIMRLVFLDLPDQTNGARGMILPFVGTSWVELQFRGKTEYYYVILAFLLLTIYATHRMARSALGYRLRAIGQNEDAAIALGHDAAAIKQRANFLSAIFTALGGTLYAQYMYFIEPNTVFGLSLSVQIALVAIIGGVGTVWGPVLGSLVLQPLAQYTQLWFAGNAALAGLQLLLNGAVLMLVILVQPRGIVGWVGRAYAALCRRLPAPGRSE